MVFVQVTLYDNRIISNYLSLKFKKEDKKVAKVELYNYSNRVIISHGMFLFAVEMQTLKSFLHFVYVLKNSVDYSLLFESIKHLNIEY